VKPREGKAKRRRRSDHCVTAQMRSPRIWEESAALQLCRAWVCFFPLSHTANTAAMQRKRITYLKVALPATREDKEKGKKRGMVALGTVTVSH